MLKKLAVVLILVGVSQVATASNSKKVGEEYAGQAIITGISISGSDLGPTVGYNFAATDGSGITGYTTCYAGSYASGATVSAATSALLSAFYSQKAVQVSNTGPDSCTIALGDAMDPTKGHKK